MLQCQRSNPLRAVDWKWQRALGIVANEQGQASRTRDGADGFGWIRRAMRFHTAYESATTDEARFRIEADDPDVFWAHYMHSEAPPHARYALQAYLLSREDDWRIGFELGQCPNVIKAYEQLFFNVREKLDHWGYISANVFGTDLQKGLLDRDYKTIWFIFAYTYGAHALKAVMSKTVNPMRCATIDTLNSAFQDDAIGTTKLLAAIAAKMTPLNYNTHLRIMELFGKVVEIERMTDSEGRAQSQLMDNIAAMLGSLPFTVEGRSPRHNNEILDRGGLAAFDTTAVELTFSETMEVAGGKTLSNAKRLAALQITQSVTATEGQPQ